MQATTSSLARERREINNEETNLQIKNGLISLSSFQNMYLLERMAKKDIIAKEKLIKILILAAL
jgi:hypothetical protein